jgi:hypothetical protein
LLGLIVDSAGPLLELYVEGLRLRPPAT